MVYILNYLESARDIVFTVQHSIVCDTIENMISW